MVVFPNCKINLGLHITAKRPDGYHDLETVFYPVPLKDALEMVPAVNPADSEEVSFQSTGLPINGNPADNLCVKAYHLLKKDFPQLPAIQMHLHKTIPMGAGLGGGSADGAFALQLFNQSFQLQLSEDALANYALTLGSDCPFFIKNKPSYASGRGEKLSEISVDLSAYQFLLIYPNISIATAWAFSQIKPQPAEKSIPSILAQPIHTWKAELKNDFELPIMEKFAAIKSIKENLYAAGAIYASLSGSGSALYGIFDKNRQPATEKFSQYASFLI